MSSLPVVLFVYNRPEHTQRTLNALKNNHDSSSVDLYIYFDGLKESATRIQKEQHDMVREIINNQKWPKSITFNESNINRGLSKSIITGITEVLKNHDRVIVLEDDIVTSPLFLRYMNNSLNTYEHTEEVISISGYMYPSKDIGRPFFIKGADCWGWATWKRGWDLFEHDYNSLLDKLLHTNRTSEFDLDNNYGYTQMLKDHIAGKINSWDIQWHASAFLANKLTLYPNKSFVQNIGIDGSGTHCAPSDQWQVSLNEEIPNLENVVIAEDQEGRELLKTFYKGIANATKPLSVYDRIKRKLKYLLKTA